MGAARVGLVEGDRDLVVVHLASVGEHQGQLLGGGGGAVLDLDAGSQFAMPPVAFEDDRAGGLLEGCLLGNDRNVAWQPPAGSGEAV
jgi:hypothetical protein